MSGWMSSLWPVGVRWKEEQRNVVLLRFDQDQEFRSMVLWLKGQGSEDVVQLMKKVVKSWEREIRVRVELGLPPPDSVSRFGGG
jgi:hypothetical protein